jgi:hypothetical protein
MQPNNVKESISFRRDQHYTSPDTVEGEGDIEIHDPMLLGDRGGGVLILGLFGHKICQGLGLDRHLRYVGYVERHKLEWPLGDLSHGELIPDNFSQPK